MTPAEMMELLAQGRLARCNATGKLFDEWSVEVLDRYTDCTGFRCPGCGRRHDDRQSWTGGPNDRMGYSLLTEQGITTRPDGVPLQR